jgi:cellulose synthase/poly-beta-1,6-N-acetylglucosamine synthase-like glycosyltransferase
MSDLLLAPTALLYVLFLLILLVYSANALYLALLAWRRRSADPAPPPLDEIPLVTVQIPLYNELYVAERVIDAVARFDWPLESLQIQVLDDSTDETQRIVGAAVERWRARRGHPGDPTDRPRGLQGGRARRGSGCRSG